MKKWKCKRCGRCCKDIPCLFAQIKFNITEDNIKPCPSLSKQGSRYTCLEMKQESSIFRQMLGYGCDSIT
jgi:hypothetical protein